MLKGLGLEGPGLGLGLEGGGLGLSLKILALFANRQTDGLGVMRKSLLKARL